MCHYAGAAPLGVVVSPSTRPYSAVLGTLNGAPQHAAGGLVDNDRGDGHLRHAFFLVAMSSPMTAVMCKAARTGPYDPCIAVVSMDTARAAMAVKYQFLVVIVVSPLCWC